jgi:hypothetical protein
MDAIPTCRQAEPTSNLAKVSKDTKEVASSLSFALLSFTSRYTNIKQKMAPHADSDKPDVVAPNEPGLDDPSAALQVGKFPKFESPHVDRLQYILTIEQATKVCRQV